MNGSGKGGNNRRRNFRRRERDNDTWSGEGKKKKDTLRYDMNRSVIFERPQWTPPQTSTDPIPTADCPYCGKPIKDMSAAVADKDSGEPVHFECIIARISAGENLSPGDSIAYIGGGRFGIVHFNNPQDKRNFNIKKILEWEDKENRSEWRKIIADHYSVT
jgi:hypothetical protein